VYPITLNEKQALPLQNSHCQSRVHNAASEGSSIGSWTLDRLAHNVPHDFDRPSRFYYRLKEIKKYNFGLGCNGIMSIKNSWMSVDSFSCYDMHHRRWPINKADGVITHVQRIMVVTSSSSSHLWLWESVALVLPIVGNWKVWVSRSLQWHNVHTKLHENPPSNSSASPYQISWKCV
jgi:hypothetical protein